jgi:hypothetical protein
MTVNKSTVASTLAAIFLASSGAFAADIAGISSAKDVGIIVKKELYTGPYVALGGGYKASKVEGTDFYDDKIEIDLNDAVFSGRLGYDKQFGDWVVGGWGGVNWQGDGEAGFDQDEFSYELAVRGGRVFGVVLAYVAGGIEFDQAEIGDPSFADKSDLDFSRMFAALGLEAPFGDGLFGNLEGRYTKGSEEVGAVSDGLLDGSDVKRRDLSIRAHLLKRF